MLQAHSNRLSSKKDVATLNVLSNKQQVFKFIVDVDSCIEAISYNVAVEDANFEFSTNATWSYGASTANNPWSTTTPVTIKNKMVIKEGTNITINNMHFEFSSQAQLIIERGATLTINGTTLTADTRCDTATMWHGVEVWGTTGAYQSHIVGGIRNSGQFILHNSVVEDAMVGVTNAKHHQNSLNNPLENYFVTGFTGGVIKAFSTTFRNNKKDIQFTDYFSTNNGNTYNDLSYFKGCRFVTDAHLNNLNLNPKEHVVMRRVKGIRFLGCTFEIIGDGLTAYTDKTQRGYGIKTYEALFSVAEKCNVPDYSNAPCELAYQEPSVFNNLYYGVYAHGGNVSTQTARITNSNFDNNFRAILFVNLLESEVTNNRIFVGYNLSYGSNFNDLAYGLYMKGCSQYKVENNDFSTSNGYYGVYVNNSGQEANEIYRNNFTNFTVACQAANINGDIFTSNGAKGLEFRCNQYFNTQDFDIYVSSGRVKSFQGLCYDDLGPVNNVFSYTAMYGDYWLEDAPATTIQSTYRYRPSSGVNLKPRDGYFNVNNNTGIGECSSLPAFNYTDNCPVRDNRVINVEGSLVFSRLKVMNTNLNQPYRYAFTETFEHFKGKSKISTFSTFTGKENVTIYPNPAKTQFTIAHNLNVVDGEIVLTVYDVMSKALLKQTLTSNEQQINTKMLKSGIYFYTLTQNNNTIKTAKLMIE